MAEGRIFESYQKMSAEDRIEFNRWLKANAVVASIFSAALVAMAFVGAQNSGSVETAAGIRTDSRSEFVASDRMNWGKAYRRARGRINENAPAHEGSARAEGLMSSIVNWLAATFDLPPIREAPRIEFIQPASMAQLRYRGSVGNQGRPLDMGRDIVALYDDTKRTIYLPKGWTGVTPAEQSLLVHEMVHHLQNVGKLKYECPEAREKLAFAAQEQWLELFHRTLAGEFKLDPFTLLVRTSCLG